MRSSDHKTIRFILPRTILPALLSMLAAAYLTGSLFVGLGNGPSAQAQTTTSLNWVYGPNGDGFWNFDFRSESAVYNNVDWPIRFLFRQNAEIDKVKNALKGCVSPIYFPSACSSGSENHLLFNDNGYDQWDGDGGIKEANSCSAGAQHMRLYANPANVYPYDRNWNSTWGYYLMASVHKDYEGGSTYSCTTYYSAEGEEGWWIQRIQNNLTSWSLVSNGQNWINADAGHWDTVGGKLHWTQSNGYGSYVWVP